MKCNRPGTKLSDVSSLVPVRAEADPKATITAGNASQVFHCSIEFTKIKNIVFIVVRWSISVRANGRICGSEIR